ALALGRDGRPAGHPALTPGGGGAGRPGAPVGRRAAGRHRGKVPPRRASAVPLYRLYGASISSALVSGTAVRLCVSVGVVSPPSSVEAAARIRELFIAP